jgi:hypothetical protein
MALSCNDDKKNLGASACKKAPELFRGAITTPEDYTITAADAASITKWQEGIVAPKGSRIYLWPKWAVNFENVSSDETREDTPLSSLPVFPGQHRYRLFFKENLELHKNMYSHTGSNGRVFLIDHELKIVGTSDDGGTTLKGFLLDDLNVMKLQPNDGSASTKTAVTFYQTDNNELDRNGFMVEGSSFLNSLISLTSVDLAEVGTSTASLITVSVKSELDNVAISGLVTGDFTVENGTITGVTEPANDGVYEIAGTTFATGTVNLVAADQLSIAGYESSGAITVTI